MIDIDEGTKQVQELVSEASRQHLRRMLPVLLALYSSAERAIEEEAASLVTRIRADGRPPTTAEVKALDERFDAVATLVHRVHQCRGALELYRREDAIKAQQVEANVKAHQQLQSMLSGEDDDPEVLS